MTSPASGPTSAPTPDPGESAGSAWPEAEATPRGTGLLELVEVMDRLRSPGGCPWDAQQTHASLAPYAVEEAYELAEAIDSGVRADVADELGDVLLQVIFHARVAQDDQAEPFDIDDVAGRIIAKLRRRHPHVFADTHAPTPAHVEANWEAIKAAEKPERTGPLDGIPAGLPPLERTAKVVSRLTRAGDGDWLRAQFADVERPLAPAATDDRADAEPTDGQPTDAQPADGHPHDDPGAQLLAAAVRCSLAGVDPAAALRHSLRELERRHTQATAASTPRSDPGSPRQVADGVPGPTR